MADEAIGIVTGFVKLWPREVFYIKGGKDLDEVKKRVDRSGVNILYKDFEVFYIGRAKSLFERVQFHAWKRYQLWNHFSAFLVPEDRLDDVEAIMIAATPRTANRQSGKRIERINLPSNAANLLLKSREISD